MQVPQHQLDISGSMKKPLEYQYIGHAVYFAKPTRCSLKKSKNQNFPGGGCPQTPLHCCVLMHRACPPLNYIFHNMPPLANILKCNPPLLIFLNATLIIVFILCNAYSTLIMSAFQSIIDTCSTMHTDYHVY